MTLCLKASKYITFINVVLNRGYASAASIAALGKSKKKVGKGLGAATEKVVHPVETDTKKLVSFVCGININKEGEDVELKPDSEYPDWLWTLNTGHLKPLSELDPNSLEYWKRVRIMGIKRNNKLRSIRPF